MTKLTAIYRTTNLALLTDLYQLTMAYGYWKSGRAEYPAIFYLHFRENPFKGGYTIAAGLEPVLDFIEGFRFSKDDTQYLSTLQGNDGKPLFEQEFLEYLLNLKLTVDVDAVPEGTVVFPQEPILKVKGPLLQCQLLETALLNFVNFQTLIATKAARICSAAQGDPVVEFGLRRAQGIDGGLSASRAAYIGGVAATSNVLAGRLYGIPVKGTHAHSWVMAFPTELEAFEAYADAMPNNCTLLPDTYDTIEGTHNAVKVAHRLQAKDHELQGIRLDSGDLAELSKEVYKILTDAELYTAAESIVASNDLDEYRITALKEQGAKISIWGVGTRLVTAYDQPALGGVYKLSAIQQDGKWVPVLKRSEQSAKSSLPGDLQIKRYTDPKGNFGGDLIYNELWNQSPPIINPFDTTLYGIDLLEAFVRGGKVVGPRPSLIEIRNRVPDQISRLPWDIILALVKPPEEFYPVVLEQNLQDLRVKLYNRGKPALTKRSS